MSREFYQGYFNPLNPEKCLNIRMNKKIIFRSSWEKRFFSFCDSNKNCLLWGSEIIKIPYIFDIDKKLHNYFPDVFVKMKNKDGSIVEYLIEIKPKKQKSPPKIPKNKTSKALKNYEYAMKEFIRNQNKWKYAKRYCETRAFKFKILTENELF